MKGEKKRREEGEQTREKKEGRTGEIERGERRKEEQIRVEMTKERRKGETEEGEE